MTAPEPTAAETARGCAFCGSTVADCGACGISAPPAPETTNWSCSTCHATLTSRTAAAHVCGAGTGEHERFPLSAFYTDPNQCSDCGRRPVIIASLDNTIRWCQTCLDSAAEEDALCRAERGECSLMRACREATEQASVEPLRDWVEAWTGERS